MANEILGIVTTAVVTPITEQVMPAMLTILGGILTLIVACYGLLLIYAMLSGQPSSDVFYKLGHWFGEREFEDGYIDYKRDRARQEQRENYRAKYDREEL